jgi:hypothetical protein
MERDDLMAYAKFDDGFSDHPKNRGLSDSAFRLHVSAILHCSRFLTDGVILTESLPDLYPIRRKSGPNRDVNQLLERGLWREIAGGSGYVIHDYLEWNDSREKVEKRRAAAAERLRNWRKTHGKGDDDE